MILNVQKILHAPGERIGFQFQLDLSQTDFNGRQPVQRPVAVAGEVRNVAGMLILHFTASTVLASVCDRCLKEFDQPKSISYECIVAESVEQENDTILLLDKGTIDLDEVARTQFILEMDTKTLCCPDCKGLCPGCGVNLNEERCRCQKEIDPRLAPLKKLLEQERFSES